MCRGEKEKYAALLDEYRRHLLHCAVELKSNDVLVTTGGMSVDPGDVTRPALLEAGLTDMLYGMPVLPGAMAMVGRIETPEGGIQVMGVPACALFFKNTVFDLILHSAVKNHALPEELPAEE